MVKLRALEPSDLDILYSWENDDRVWFSSSNTRPVSKQTLQFFIDSINDIYTDKQVRLVIEHENTPVGCVDLFDFEPLHQRAGVGIMIDENHEGKSLAHEALKELQNYAFNQLGLHQLYCNVSQNNERSIHLFNRSGFMHTATRKEWVKEGKNWYDQFIFQCFNNSK
ncbi:GNAT family N-acetyltransferase [bacterium SCSIO 12643]|nr:GNAT family N-acetyltransferase [bacterium SCSIO 12643]